MQAGRRFEHIHGLRGLAAIAVLVQHACEVAQGAGSPIFRGVLGTIDLGRVGILIFFMISGFVVPFSFHGRRPLRSFVLSRFFRLYPAYWVSLPILTLISFHIGLRPDLGTILANITMMESLGGWPNMDPVYWTLEIELIFYAMCIILWWRNLLADPMFVGTIVLFTLIAAIAPALMGQAIGSPLAVIDLAFFVAMFFMGMLLRFVFIDGSKLAQRWACILVPVIVLEGLVMGGAFFPVAENKDALLPPAVLCPSMALPILLFVAILWIKPVPGKIAMYLGTISYSVYLFQDIGLRLLPDWISPAASPLAYLASVIAVTILVASFVYRWIERPAIAIGRDAIKSSDLKTRRELSPA